MTEFTDRTLLYCQYSEAFEHDKWREEIPYLHFPYYFRVQMLPPFAGAVVRFRVKDGDKLVSVYLDCYDTLAAMGEPYWERYPSHTGDVERFPMNDTGKLIKAIKRSLKSKRKE